jgi:hypothetical protein
MFIGGESYYQSVTQLVAASPILSVAVAFWGQGADKLFEHWHGSSLRIICNLASGGTNPRPIRGLIDSSARGASIEVRQCDDLHAKVLVGANGLLVGSANHSVNGLGLEADESAHWREAGLYSESTSEIAAAHTWFERVWAESRNVSCEDLAQAEEAWNHHRRWRPQQTGALLGQSQAQLRGRQIYLAIYRQPLSKMAEDELALVKADLQRSPAGQNAADRIDCFECWPELPRQASLISVRIGPRGGVSVEGSFRRLPQYDRPLGDGGESEQALQIVELEDNVASLRFTKDDMKALAVRLKAWLARPDPSKEQADNRIVSFEDFLASEFQQAE